jgi:hypothetical protein
MRQPFVPPDVDLHDFAFMPLDVLRLRDSDFVAKASAEGFRAAILLWCAAWHQDPASSLPNDDVLLAKLAGYGRDVKGFAEIRDEALYGFEECSDGRLYHRIIAEKAISAWEKKRKQCTKAIAGAKARWGKGKSGQLTQEAIPGALPPAKLKANPRAIEASSQAMPVASSRPSSSSAQNCQETGREIGIGRNGSPVREPIGTSTPQARDGYDQGKRLDYAPLEDADPFGGGDKPNGWSRRI